jgi:hypothetical protein
MKKRIFYLFLSATMFAAGCDKPEQFPAYLRIEPFIINENGGAAWHEVTDGWLYVNNEFLGAYTLPATVPVLAEGESEVILFPGVKENGIANTPNIYPFLTRYEVTVNLTPPDITSIQPSTAYDPSATIVWENKGNFDGNPVLQFENRDADTATAYVLTTEGSFAGKSLQMEVDTAHIIMEIASEKTALPTTGAQEVWLELHYNTDMPFYFNLLGSTGSSPEIGQAVYLFNETEGWNKIYINLTEFLIVSAQENYRLDFRAILPKDEKGKYTQNAGKVMLDNIRVLHF